MLTRWTPTGTPTNEGFQVNAFNGRSWPNTERLAYTVGDSVRWQVINASGALHEMHLHGFFFLLNARGYTLDTSTVRDGSVGQMRVTAVLRPGEWLRMAWSPDRPGNWLYHCHLLAHMSGAQRLDRMPGTVPGGATTAKHAHAGAGGNHAMDDMAGLVIGLDVAGSPGARAVAVRHTPAAERTIDLFASARPRVFGERAGYGFVLQEGPRAPAPDSIRIPGRLVRDSNPHHEIPIIPVRPSHPGCAAIQASTSSASRQLLLQVLVGEHALGVAAAAQVDPHTPANPCPAK